MAAAPGPDTRHLWGTFDMALDAAGETLQLIPSQQTSAHHNVSSLTAPGFFADNVTLSFVSLNRQNRVINFDLTLRNPFDNITGYDVRAIIVANDPEYFLLNADGAVDLSADDNLGTFIAFAKNQPSRAFGPRQSYTERCKLHFPENPHFRKLRLVIDASYPGNCAEPYAFSDFSYIGNTISLGVLDWRDDVDDVRIASTAIGASADITLEYDAFSGTWSGRLAEMPGMGFVVKSALFRGALTDPYGTASITADIPSLLDPSLLLCPIKAESRGASLWGFILLDVIDAPQETISPDGGRLSPELMELHIDPLAQDDDVRIIAFIAGTPPDALVWTKEAADAAYPEIREIENEINRAYKAAQPEIARFSDEYHDAFISGDPSAISLYSSILARHGADRAAIAWKVRNLESLREQRADYARQLIESAMGPIQADAIDEIQRVSDTALLSADPLLNCLFIQTKVRHLAELSTLRTIEYIQEDFTLVLPQLNRSVPSILADEMWDAGYTGGSLDVLVVDLGVDDSHAALSSHMDSTTQKAFQGCSYDDSNGHGTHIAGIVASTNSTYTGVAYGLDKILNGKICSPYYWDWFVDALEWGGLGGYAADRAEITNFSWAMGPADDCVRDGNWPTSRYFDAYTYVYGQFFAIAAGNDGEGVCGDDDMITMPSDAFNIVAVGNMEDHGTTSRSDDNISSSSRKGPGTTSNGEYRVKPDVAAPGTNIKSANNDWETGPSYIEASGTSMAAPHVAGAAALLMDAGLTSSLSARAMLLNSADDWNGSSTGPGTNGPDKYTGFGYINLGNALLNLGNINAGSVKANDVKLFSHSGQAADDTVLVLWDRHCSGYYNYYPDIDLYIYNAATGALIDSEDKSRDNKRYLYAGTTDDVIYKIKAKYIPLTTYWDYAITATGGTLSGELGSPDIDPELIYTEPIPIDEQFDIQATITNNWDFPLHGVYATLTLDTDMTFESGSTATQSCASTLNPAEECTVTWHVKLHAYSHFPKHIEVDTEADAFGETFTGHAEADLEIVEIPPELYVNPTELDFGAITESKTFFIQNHGGGIVTWSIDDSSFPAWLSVDENGGTTQAETDPVQVTIDRDGLDPDVYAHDINVNSDAGNEIVHVTMVVPNPVIHLEPVDLDFGDVVTLKTIAISNDGNGELTWQILHDPPNEYPAWLNTNIDSGKVEETEANDTIIVTVDRTGLMSGDYEYDMNFSSDGGDGVVHITMGVAGPLLYVNPTSLDFGMYDEMKFIYIENHGDGIMTWNIDQPNFPDWLSVDDADGTTQDETDSVAVYVDRDGIEPGQYAHDINVTSDGGNEIVQVGMEVPNPILHIEPGNLDFGEIETNKSLTITNAGNGELNWEILHLPPYDFPGWLSVDIYSGKIDETNTEDEVSVTVDRDGMDAGDYDFDMHFTSNGGDAVVHIDMSVPYVPAPVLDVDPTELDFGTDTDDLQIHISNAGDDGSILHWDIPITGMPDWVYADKYIGELDTTQTDHVTISVDRDGLEPDEYFYNLQVNSDGGFEVVYIQMEVPGPYSPPVLTGPADGYHYEVCSPLVFTWDGNPGYDGKFYFDVKYNGTLFYPFSNLPVSKNSLALPPSLIDKLAKYGTWEWRIYIIESDFPPIMHYSDWRTIYKDRPDLITPPDESIVNKASEFTWNKVPSVDAPNTWYVAKLTGLPGADPYYAWWRDADKAILPPGWHAILKNSGATTFGWTVAAVSGDPATPDGKGMTHSYAAQIRYPPKWIFYVQ